MICASAIYGGTFNLLGVTLKKLGIECTFVDVDADEETLNAAFRPNTKAVLAESISNPALVVLDIEKMAKIAHAHGVPLIVDNTFGNSGKLPSVRVGRRHRRTFHYKIYGRSRNAGRRRDRRQRKF